MKERLVGVLMLSVGVLLAYLCVYEPLQAAARNDPNVSIHLKGAILCPIALVMGAAYLILGTGAASVFGTREKPSAAAWVSVILLALAGLGLYAWIKSALEAKGYQF